MFNFRSNNYYGGDWASFNLETVKEWAASKTVSGLEE